MRRRRGLSAPSLHAPRGRAGLQRLQRTMVGRTKRVPSPGQCPVPAGGRGRHGPLQGGAPVRLGHGGVGGDAAVSLGHGGQVVGGVVVETVQISEGTGLK